MEKSFLENLISRSLSIREIAAETGISATNIRYWLGKHELTTNPTKTHACACGETDPTKFYGLAKRECKACFNRRCQEQWVEKKKKAIAHLGGKCRDCGYDRYYGALEFHHLNPNEKDVDWGKLRLRPWDDITRELDKCTCLCANCHREAHRDIKP